MVILPTEKRLDWKHAPFMLCLIVLINIAVFFLYQSSDDQKYFDAFTEYQDNDFLEQEWPLFSDFIIETGEIEKIAQYRTYYETQDERLIWTIISREGFFQHLIANEDEFISRLDVDQWRSQRSFINDQVLSISSVKFGLNPEKRSIPTFITHQFMHGDFMHLFGNLFFLIIVGFAVEAAIGHYRFLLFYLLSGIAGGGLHIYFNQGVNNSLIGASGAISGVMTMYLGVFRFKKIEFFYWFFMFVGFFRAPALLILPFFIGKEIYSFYVQTESNVAFMAHAGGAACGTLLMVGLLLLKPKLLNHQYIEEDQDRDLAAESLAKVYQYIEQYRFNAAFVALNKLIKEHGPTFKLINIRFNLIKLFKGKHFIPSFKQVITYKDVAPIELEQLNAVWQEHKDLEKHLSEDQLITLGFRLTNLENPEIGREIFDVVHIRNKPHPQLAGLAKAVALNFKHQDKKHQKYMLLAQQLN